MISNLGEYLDNVIYPRLDRALVFKDLNPVLRGEILDCDCPSCGKRKAYTTTSTYQLKCWSCNYCVRILAYVARTTAPLRGKDFLDAINKLADMAGVPSPETVLPPEAFKAIHAEANRASVFEKILSICRDELSSPWGADDARKFLENRNFQIEKHPFGWLEPCAELAKNLSKDSLVECGVMGRREDGSTYWSFRRRVIGPLTDRHGRIVGFWGRIIDKDTDSPKYLWTKGATVATSAAYGLGEANLDSLYLVEGVLDVFKARQHGIFNFAAFAGTAAQNRWKALAQDWKIRECTLLFDNDKAGQKATIAAVESAFKHARGITLYVVPPAVLGDCKDPDEYMDKYGGESLTRLIKAERLPATIYYAKAVLNGTGHQS
jgi:DNA primase